MASASDFNRYRASGSAYMRDALNAVHRHGSGAGGKVWGFLLAFPAIVQGGYYILTGIWPVVHIGSFQAVTGPKTDLWLVQTVGLLVTVIGVVLCVAGYRKQQSAEILVLAFGSALALGGIDVYFVMQRQISAIYLMDAVLELGILVMWVSALYNAMEQSPPVQIGPPHPAAAVPTVPTVPTRAPVVRP